MAPKRVELAHAQRMQDTADGVIVEKKYEKQPAVLPEKGTVQ